MDPSHPEPARTRQMTRTRERDRCPSCARKLVSSKFDTTFRLPDRSERLCFAIPAGLCRDCRQLYIDPSLIAMLDLDEARCVFAIESDLVLQGQAFADF
jgi:hypothetical protein